MRIFCWGSRSFRAARLQNRSSTTSRRSSWILVPTRLITIWLSPTSKQNKLQLARTQLEQAVASDPKQANAAYDLGIVLLELGSQPQPFVPCNAHML